MRRLSAVTRRAVGALAVLGAVLCAPTLRAEGILPVSELRPGMKGVGRTVFEGTKIEEFQVELIGVLQNTSPKASMILARLEGGPLANTGVIAGMSGSPVYIEGKLIGAVAYGFPFSKETIAGITPIQEMIDTTREGSSVRAASARFPAPWSAAAGGAPLQPLDRDTLMAALQRPFAAQGVNAQVPGRSASLSLKPLALPLSFAGFDPATFEFAREVFGAAGFAPVMGTGGGAPPAGPLPDLAPGSPIGISLVEGDLDVSVTGTVTHVDGQQVYAFGHPFYNLGPTAFPMKKAYVYSVFPSLYQSWKISTAGEVVGTVEQDRIAAVAGKMGKAPRMVPVELNLTTSRGQQKTFSFRMVEDELFTPALAYMSVMSVLQANERAYGTSTISVDSRLTLGGGREVRVQDLFTERQPAAQAAALVAAPLAYIMANDMEKVSLDKLTIDVESQEVIQTAQIQRVWLERPGPVRPGMTLPARILLKTYRGESRVETVPVTIPDNAPAGNYTLLVADGATVTAQEQREMRQAFVPKDLDQLLRALNGLRHNNHVYLKLMRPDEGAIVGGEFLQSLPPSVLSVLGRPEHSGTVVPIRTATVWDHDLAVDYAVTGSRLLNLTVER